MFSQKFILHQYLNGQFALLSAHNWNQLLQAASQTEGKKDNASPEEISCDMNQAHNMGTMVEMFWCHAN